MFSAQVERALGVAVVAHDGQYRRGAPRLPYVVHPMHIALMLARWGLEEELVVAALLHDVVEDCEDWDLARLEEHFGGNVASIVSQLTEDKSKSWEERKRTAVEHVPHMTDAAVTVKAVDKLHNLQSLLADLRSHPQPDDVWAKFRGGRDGTLRHARELVAALEKRVESRIARELTGVLHELLAEVD